MVYVLAGASPWGEDWSFLVLSMLEVKVNDMEVNGIEVKSLS